MTETIPELYLLRHAETAQSGKYIGRTDAVLSPSGMQSFTEHASALKKIHFHAVYCSPLQRCRQTLELLFPACVPLISDAVREIDFGDWEGRTFDEIHATCPEEIEKWSASEKDFVFPGGESVADFRRRIEDFASTLRTEPKYPVLIVSHGGVIRHLLCFLLNIPYDHHLCFSVMYGRFARVELYSEGGVLSALNW